MSILLKHDEHEAVSTTNFKFTYITPYDIWSMNPQGSACEASYNQRLYYSMVHGMLSFNLESDGGNCCSGVSARKAYLSVLIEKFQDFSYGCHPSGLAVWLIQLLPSEGRCLMKPTPNLETLPNCGLVSWPCFGRQLCCQQIFHGWYCASA